METKVIKELIGLSLGLSPHINKTGKKPPKNKKTLKYFI